MINHLRKKIDAKQEKRLITTVRGVGYVIKDEPNGAPPASARARHRRRRAGSPRRYASLLVGTMVVFGVAVWAMRDTRRAERRRQHSRRRLDRRRRFAAPSAVSAQPESALTTTIVDSTSPASPSPRRAQGTARRARSASRLLPGARPDRQAAVLVVADASCCRRDDQDEAIAATQRSKHDERATGSAIDPSRDDSLQSVSPSTRCRRRRRRSEHLARRGGAAGRRSRDLPPQLLIGTLIVVAPIILLLLDRRRRTSSSAARSVRSIS